jgi:hypothetical protein
LSSSEGVNWGVRNYCGKHGRRADVAGLGLGVRVRKTRFGAQDDPLAKLVRVVRSWPPLPAGGVDKLAADGLEEAAAPKAN